MLVFIAHYSNILLKRSAIIPCFCQKMDVIIPLFCQKRGAFFRCFVKKGRHYSVPFAKKWTLLWTEKRRFQPFRSEYSWFFVKVATSLLQWYCYQLVPTCGGYLIPIYFRSYLWNNLQCSCSLVSIINSAISKCHISLVEERESWTISIWSWFYIF